MGNATATQFTFRAHGFSAVNAETGVIQGVAVITEGPARGHFDWKSSKPLYVDSTTLQEVKSCAETYKGGLKVKMDHFSGVTEIVGALRNFTIDGQVLRADLHLLRTTKHREYILEIADAIPDAFGLSISFSGSPDVSGDRALARCTEIYSADLVSEPAANPTGLFEAKPASTPSDKPGANPNQPTNMEDNKEQLASLQKAIDALSARLDKIEKPAAPATETPEQLKAKLDEVANLAAENALKKFAATLGTPPAAPSAPATPPANPADKKFEELVREHPKYSEDKAFAVSDTVAKHPKAHADYLARVHSGADVIVF